MNPWLQAALAFYTLALLFVWSLCVAARRGDDMAEAAWQAHLRDTGRAP